jgi:hypothetical protein
MAKSQMRSNKETRKPKATEKAPKSGPKYKEAANLSGPHKGLLGEATRKKK